MPVVKPQPAQVAAAPAGPAPVGWPVRCAVAGGRDPPNLVYLLLPLREPINLSVALHVLLMGVLVLNESWCPGWSARVNGRPQEALRANGGFQGLWVEPGRSSIELTFDPPGLKTGAILSGLTALLVIVLLIGRPWKVRAGREPKTPA
jgi:hypothetical protein